MPALVSDFPEATPARAPLRSRTGETAFTPSLPIQETLGTLLVGFQANQYHSKGSHTGFWFPSAYRSYIHTVLSSVKCAVALCLKKLCTYLN